MSRPFQVLLIEDDDDDIDLTQEVFHESKIRAQLNITRDGTEAMAYLQTCVTSDQKSIPDLIFLDLNLPGMSGKDIISAIRRDQNLRHIPISVLTTSQSPKDVQDCYRLGANCFVSKPVGLQEFYQTIQQLENFWFTVTKIPHNPAW